LHKRCSRCHIPNLCAHKARPRSYCCQFHEKLFDGRVSKW
jgi:hypothetical protein